MPASSSSIWRPMLALAMREWVRFFRQRTRVVGALGQPLIFWVLFGTGLGDSFRMPGGAGAAVDYQTYFLPGIAVLIVLFTAIFATISIIEDRREGFLQGVLASPAPRTAIVLGKLTGGTLLAVGQALLFIILAPLLSYVGLAPEIGWSLSALQWLELTAFLTLIAFALTGLGYVIAWPMESTQGFHAIMSVFLMPMWLLSGAFFPMPDSGWLKWVMTLNPLTYGVTGLRLLVSSTETTATNDGLTLQTCVMVTTLFAVATVAVSVWMTRKYTGSHN